VSLLDAQGKLLWTKPVGGIVRLTSRGDALYAAGWDGRLRKIDPQGNITWSINLTESMNDPSPMRSVAENARLDAANLRIAERDSTAFTEAPAGENLLTSGKATLTLGGTGGWMSNGKVEIKAEQLTNGKLDDVTTPWLHIDEIFWDAEPGRQVYAEVTFKQPSDVKSITVYENPSHPESFPRESVVQAWDESQKRWTTAARGLFLSGAVNTYQVDLKAVTKLRYVPWSDYYRNFYTSEIEVR